MDPKIREAIGLLRHQIISPVLVEKGRVQMTYFRSLEEKDFDVPGQGSKRFKASTMKSWLYRYKAQGFPGIVPAPRKDQGAFRKIDSACREKIRQLRRECLDLSVVQFYERCVKADVLGRPPFGVETLRRFLKQEGLFTKTAPAKARKRYEMSRFGELWVGDFMHGPEVKPDSSAARKKKAILMAIIDDHSRFITGFEFGFAEDTKLVETVFKDAILNHGIPDRLYCDNGPSFSSTYLSLVCAHLNVGLVHSKPYDSPSRGKIERFFRTVRQGFLIDVKEDDDSWTLEKLNTSFRKWIAEYHLRNHHGIAGRPIDRVQISIREYPRKRIDAESLEEYFLATTHRCVNKDSTVSLHGVIFEVPTQFIDQKVELKFKQGQSSEVFLYHNSRRITRITPVDSQMNGMQYKPSPRISDVALHQIIKPGEKK